MTKVVTAVELDVDYCSLEFGVLPCRAALGYADGRVGPYAAIFDGVSDYMSRGANLTGVVDGKAGSLSAWVNFTSTGSMLIFTTTNDRFALYVASGFVLALGRNAANTTIMDFNSGVAVNTGWKHILASWDLATASIQMYINDVASLAIATNTNDTIDYTNTDFFVGANAVAAGKFEGRIAELWISTTTRIDFSVAANRRKFIDANGRPVYLGAIGEIPLGAAPAVFLSGEVDAWHTNKGAGGGFTLATNAILGEQIFKDHKCFQTLSTCGDIDNFDDEGATFVFAKPAPWFPRDVSPVNKSLVSLSYSPGRVSIGESLGQRSSVSVVFNDRPHSDTAPGADKYLDERDYDPYHQGTFFGKFRQRHAFLRGEILRWITGTSDQDYADMESRTFLVDSFSGPDTSGKFSITAKDPLKFLDGDHAQVPRQNTGFLVADITNVATSATLSPAGVGELEYPAWDYANIGGAEIVSFFRGGGINAQTSVMLHFDGADASTTFTDSSPTPHTWTPVATAQIDTAQSVFGGASGLFDGNSDYISTPNNTNLDLGDGDWSIDFRVRTAVATPGTNYVILDRRSNVSPFPGWQIIVDTNDKLSVNISTVAGAATVSVLLSTTVLAINTWYHVIVDQRGPIMRLRINGVLEDIHVGRPLPAQNALFIGANILGTGAFLNGWLDELRIQIGASQWPRHNNVSIPTAAYASTGGDTLTITRGVGVLGTPAVAHSAEDRVQVVRHYGQVGGAGVNAAYILADLLYDAGVPAEYMPITSWISEIEDNLDVVYSGTIASPESARDLANEIIEQAALVVWWDPRQSQIRLQVVKEIPTTADLFDETRIVKGSLEIEEQPSLRLSQVWTFFNRRDPLTSLTDDKNYRSVAAKVDLDTEELYGQPAIKKIYSRWISTGGRSTADRLNDLIIARYKHPPRKFSFSLPRHRGVEDEVTLGGGYRISSRWIQDDTGAEIAVGGQVVSLDPREDVYAVVMIEMLFDLPLVAGSERIITIDSNQNNLNFQALHDGLFGAPTTGLEVIRLVVETGVIVGSNNAASPAFDVGTWSFPAQPLTIEIRGRIQGKGGDGGSGADGFGTPAGVGTVGGPALYTRKSITVKLDVGDGDVFGGGGGGGGGGPVGGGGGGGGAGKEVGPGGAAAAGGTNGSNGTTEAGGAGGGGAGGIGPGGAGGGPGIAGTAGTTTSGPGGAGGAAGASVDGTSFCTYVGTGDIRGSQIN